MYMQLQFLSDINSGTFGLEKIGILVLGAKIDCFHLSYGIGGTTEFFKNLSLPEISIIHFSKSNFFRIRIVC